MSFWGRFCLGHRFQMGHRLKRTLIIYACIAQLVERSLGKAEVTGSILVVSSIHIFKIYEE